MRNGRRHARLLGCLALSLALHLVLALVWHAQKRPGPAPVVHLTPALEKFVKLPSPDRRLARPRRPSAPQRPISRKPTPRPAPTAAVRPPVAAVRSLPALHRPIPLVHSAMASERPLAPIPDFPASLIGAQQRVGALKGVRQTETEIDLALELVGVEALDTGRHRAVVVVDPRERRNLKGFLYLSGAYSASVERGESESYAPRRYRHLLPDGVQRQVAERETLRGLADRMNEQTQVVTRVLDGLALDDPRLLEVPFLLFTVNNAFTFTQAEAVNLGRYLTSGGFLYAEVVSWPGIPSYAWDWPALRGLIETAFSAVGLQKGKDWNLVRLEMDHPLYHCYHDIDGLPLGFWDWTWAGTEDPMAVRSPDYLEGIELRGELVGVYSRKDYADFWAGAAERIREEDEARLLRNGRFAIGGEENMPYKLGVNVLVYALTREGSLARQLVAVE